MYKFSNERLLQQLFFPFQRNECRFKGDNTDFIAIFSIVHISNFAYMKNHKPCSFSTVPKKNPPDSSRQRAKERKKEWTPKILLTTSCVSIHKMARVRKNGIQYQHLLCPMYCVKSQAGKHTEIAFDFLNHS